MFKTIKKITVFMVLACLALLLVGCTSEITEDACNKLFPAKDPTEEQCGTLYPCESTTCPDQEDWTEEQCNQAYPHTCPTCPDWTEQQCMEKYPFDSSVCDEYQEFVAVEEIEYYTPSEPLKPGDVYDIWESGEDVALTPEEENVIKAFVYSSSDETVATIDANGVITALRPGETDITITSAIDASVTASDTLRVADELTDPLAVIAREKADIQAQLVTYANASFDFPETWNKYVAVSYKEGSDAVEGFEIGTVTTTVKRTFTIELSYRDSVDSFTWDIYAVQDMENNEYVRVETAKMVAEAYLKDYATYGQKVTGDITLPNQVFGVTLAWSTDNASVISTEGVYGRPTDDKRITLGYTISLEPVTASVNYVVVAAGYTAAEKFDYIINEGSLATIAGKATNTNVVFPTRDAKFGVALSYKSSNPAIIDDAGVIVAHPTEATEVEFTVTGSYDRVGQTGVQEFNFAAETATFKVTVNPANAAALAANAFLAENDLDEQLYFPYGLKGREGNTLPIPATYTHNEVEYQVSVVGDEAHFANADGKATLVTQFLRFTEARAKVTFTSGEGAQAVSATAEILLNVGVSNDSNAAYLGWRNTEQQDTTITPSAGLYDVVMAVSYFDKAVGNPKSSYNKPNGASTWSGYTLYTVDGNGQAWQDFVLQAMTVYIKKDANGNIYYDNTHYAGSYSQQTNWGKFFVNLTDETVKVQVGTYASGNDKDGNPIVAYGYRDGNTFDGYAIGFVADASGKVLVGSEGAKFQNYISTSAVTTTTAEDGTTSQTGAWPKLAIFAPSDNAGGGDAFVSEIDTTVENFALPTVEAGYNIAPYVEIPAGGCGMSWKYQFYGVGSPTCRAAFMTAGAQIEVTEFNLHPENSIDAINAKSAIDNLNSGISTLSESTIANARHYYDRLKTEEEKAYAGNIVGVEQTFAGVIDGLITQKLTESGNADYAATLAALYDRVQALTPEISQHLTKKADLQAEYESVVLGLYVISLNYNGGVAVVGGQAVSAADTAANYSTVLYAEEATTVELPVASKTGYVFQGWFEDEACTIAAAITGERKSDITLYAGWLHEYNKYLNDITPAGLSQVFYSANSITAGANNVPGTFDGQYATTGFGNVAMVVGGKIFFLGNSALIELNSATIGKTELDIPDLKVFGKYNATSVSEGLLYDATTGAITVGDTYGYGVLYKNTGSETLTFAAASCYGRNLGSPQWGYDKWQLALNAETGLYTATIRAAGNPAISLAPGEYLWCPFWAERQTTGLTNCNGTSGTTGVLNGFTADQVATLEVGIYTFAELEALANAQ